ncbi:tetrahydromethanopterin S-methyltransferase subunit MtrB [Methanocella arvoryzae]|jgi:tetrahydromethanopterin S-methyltransferase subunit B|uniref:Tetrahydromethanopterin S-methyltransferase subunit B n=1 Tax=Methanocella arvoryzae (strain DSM 22066 / NBRC 105507 / MRE50) TaxID=351160 RepID=Q0W335_METAR|nr:tetrahydromethanopterin S-methyltransferase subunit B [Methanocella arvoryzae]CAJ37208.1 N(5)-methyltetrahydromethanopterin-coenzyme M methyltransferase, subunit B [Methanocella arvoryzae MRE50]
MTDYVKLLPEYKLSYNYKTGKVEPEAGGVVKYNFKPINENLDKLDKYADDLMNSLTPTGPFLETYPGREKSLYYASIGTNLFYGFIFGGIAAFVLVMLILAKVI